MSNSNNNNNNNRVYQVKSSSIRESSLSRSFAFSKPPKGSKMKRRHSWDGDQQPMMKMHYSEKDEAVKSGAMESVYRKTLQMLFSGANR